MDGLILGLDLCDGYTQLSCWGRGRKLDPSNGSLQTEGRRMADRGNSLCHSSGWRGIRDG